MFSNNKPVLVALLLAYRALAAPTSHDQQDQVQSVIDALKVQVKELNLPWNPSIIDDVESALRENGALDAEHVAALNQKIEVSRCHHYSNDLVTAWRVFSSNTTYKLSTNGGPS